MDSTNGFYHFAKQTICDSRAANNVESLKILEILKIAKFIDFEKFKIIKHSDF